MRNVLSKRNLLFGFAAMLLGLAGLARPADAGINVMEKNDSYLDMGMLLDIQARDVQNASPNMGIKDGVFFRRLRPFLYGAINKDWQGIIQLDFGNGFEGQDAKSSIKWAYMEYLGIESNQQTSLKIGSFKPPFSREFLTLGPRLQQIERTSVGMNWHGTPDYLIGVGLDRMTPDRKMMYAVAAGSMSINPRSDRIFMQMPLNNTSSANNEGWMVAGRIDYYPWGEMPFNSKPLASENAYNRGDFNHTQEWRLMLSGAAYSWWNNNNNNVSINTGNPNGNSGLITNQDVRSTYGFEASAGLRGFGFSGDIEYQYVHGNLLNQIFTGGLYENGTTGLNKFTVNGGYMVYKEQWEPTVTFSVLDASNYASVWTQTTFGINWFIRHYDIRVTANYSVNNNVSGVTGQWENVARIQSQFAW